MRTFYSGFRYAPIWLAAGVLLMLSACGSDEKKTTDTAQPPADTVAAPITQVAGIGRVEPEARITDLSADQSGIVARIFVRENQTVSRGQVLLELDHQVEDATIARVQAAIRTQQAQIETDRLNVSEFDTKYANANQELGRLQTLLAKGAETVQTVDNARTQTQTYATTARRFTAAVRVSEARLGELTSELNQARVAVARKRVKAPVSGTLLSLAVTEGEAVTAQQSFGQLRPAGATIVVAEVDELLADRVRTGQTALIRPVGSTKTLATGTVYFTAAYLKKKSLFTDAPGEAEDRRVRELKIRLDSTANLLLNARVECLINLNR